MEEAEDSGPQTPTLVPCDHEEKQLRAQVFEEDCRLDVSREDMILSDPEVLPQTEMRTHTGITPRQFDFAPSQEKSLEDTEDYLNPYAGNMGETPFKAKSMRTPNVNSPSYSIGGPMNNFDNCYYNEEKPTIFDKTF